jgi:hypothetical protein
VEGYRSLESGDLRILEDGSSRVTEGFLEGFAVLSATGTVSAVSKLKASGISPLSSTGSVLLAGQGIFFGRLNVSATGSVVTLGQTRAFGSISVQGVGNSTYLGLKILHGTTALSGSGVFESKAGFKFTGSLAVSGIGSFTTIPHYTAQGIFGPFDEDVVRILESGDTRITEEGDTRVVVNFQPNVGYGSILTVPTVTLFSSEPYAKYESNWLRAVPYVKYEQEWIVPANIYKHVNGNWKRIY